MYRKQTARLWISAGLICHFLLSQLNVSHSALKTDSSDFLSVFCRIATAFGASKSNETFDSVHGGRIHNRELSPGDDSTPLHLTQTFAHLNNTPSISKLLLSFVPLLPSFFFLISHFDNHKHELTLIMYAILILRPGVAACLYLQNSISIYTNCHAYKFDTPMTQFKYKFVSHILLYCSVAVMQN